MTDTLLVRPAGLDDMPIVVNLIDEASAWLRTKDTDQWAKPWPSRKARDNRVANGLRLKRTWLVVDHEDTPVATITCRRYPNQNLWSRAEQLEQAVYVSRLIVARRHAGLGIGEALIDWAGKRAQKQWKAEWIRIDVWTTNNALRDYYEKRGFRFCREVIFPEGTPWDERYPSAALFQKPIDVIHGTPAVQFTEISSRVLPQPATSGTDQASSHFGAHDSPAPEVPPGLCCN
jgi:ribosomal protein S18 acetylase RimI-like enzyme